MRKAIQFLLCNQKICVWMKNTSFVFLHYGNKSEVIMLETLLGTLNLKWIEEMNITAEEKNELTVLPKNMFLLFCCGVDIRKWGFYERKLCLLYIIQYIKLT